MFKRISPYENANLNYNSKCYIATRLRHTLSVLIISTKKYKHKFQDDVKKAHTSWVTICHEQVM
jgi:hypothetical protein